MVPQLVCHCGRRHDVALPSVIEHEARRGIMELRSHIECYCGAKWFHRDERRIGRMRIFEFELVGAHEVPGYEQRRQQGIELERREHRRSHSYRDRRDPDWRGYGGFHT